VSLYVPNVSHDKQRCVSWTCLFYSREVICFLWGTNCINVCIIFKLSPCGEWLEYLLGSPESRKRRQKGNPVLSNETVRCGHELGPENERILRVNYRPVLSSVREPTTWKPQSYCIGQWSTTWVMRTPELTKACYIYQNEIQEPLESWTIYDPRTHEDSSQNWGSNRLEVSSIISLTGQSFTNNW
jgi:hypothetical protein